MAKTDSKGHKISSEFLDVKLLSQAWTNWCCCFYFSLLICNISFYVHSFLASWKCSLHALFLPRVLFISQCFYTVSSDYLFVFIVYLIKFPEWLYLPYSARVQLSHLLVHSIPPTVFTILHFYLIRPQWQKNAFTEGELRCRPRRHIYSSLKVGLLT